MERERQELAQLEQRRQEQSKVVVENADIPQIGKDIPDTPAISIQEVYDNPFNQIIEGYIFDYEVRELRSGSQLMIMKVTDYTSSITAKLMAGRNIKKESFGLFKKGDWVRLEGSLKADNFTGEMDFSPRSIRKISKASRQDQGVDGAKRIELHLHSNMSQMDATNKVGDLIAQAAAWGHPAIAITDHAGAQAFPDAYAAGKKHGIKVLMWLMTVSRLPIIRKPLT